MLLDEPRGRTLLMQGNECCVEAALAAGLRFFAGYPITPSTEIAELLSLRLPEVGGKFIQMEDELASMGAVIGASLAGLKAMTATSGPGFSLKQENIGYASLAEVPCVIVNVQRAGPSTGLPTAPLQGDVMQSRWGTHGDHPVVVLCPSSVSETYDLTIQAFNISEMLRVPVILLMDEVVAHMREKVTLPDPSVLNIISRKQPAVPPEEFLAYAPDEDDVPPLPAFGSGYRFNVTGLFHDKAGFPTADHSEVDYLLRRLTSKIERRRSELTFIRQIEMEDADVVVVSYGITARSALGAVRRARAQGYRAGLIHLLTLWPFPDEVVALAAARAKAFIVPEMNLGQVYREVERAAHGRAEVHGLFRVDCDLITPGQVLDKIREVA